MQSAAAKERFLKKTEMVCMCMCVVYVVIYKVIFVSYTHSQELAKKSEEAMKLNSVEKLVYALEDKDKIISNMKIQFERELFECQKQLHEAQTEITVLKSALLDHEKTEGQLRFELELLKSDQHGLLMTGNNDRAEAKSGAGSGITGGGSKPVKDTIINTNTNIVNNANTPIAPSKATTNNITTNNTKASSTSRFSLSGMFGK